jgi:hypothetical protein
VATLLEVSSAVALMVSAPCEALIVFQLKLRLERVVDPSSLLST